ncbi:MAG: hypothetical protein QW567_03795 [Candidatus Hadarchaeales archaeon]
MRQNRQFAIVEVNDNFQTLRLFINVISLDPGENIKTVVPLRNLPTGLEATKTAGQVIIAGFSFGGACSSLVAAVSAFRIEIKKTVLAMVISSVIWFAFLVAQPNIIFTAFVFSTLAGAFSFSLTLTSKKKQ